MNHFSHIIHFDCDMRGYLTSSPSNNWGHEDKHLPKSVQWAPSFIADAIESSAVARFLKFCSGFMPGHWQEILLYAQIS